MVATTRTVFDHQLSELQFKTIQLSELVATQAEQAISALDRRDTDLARSVDKFDANINQQRYDLEEKCYTLLALQQPNSRDMRRIVATVSVVTNLERMGDHVAGIARLTLRMDGKPALLFVPEFKAMQQQANANLADAMRALAAEDPCLAREVVRRDAVIDKLHKTVYDRLIGVMTQDPSTVECATMLMWVSHNLERYADRISNISERVIYLATGDLREPRADLMP